MSIEHGGPNPEELERKKYELYAPTFEELESADLETLREHWRKNHQKLFELLQKIQPPYFALHGTNQQAFEKIKESRTGFFQVGTFDKKNYQDEKFLYQLYHMMMYVYARADKPQLGQIIVFDTEKNGQNIAVGDQKLNFNALYLTLKGDSPEETTSFSELQDPDNLLDHYNLSFYGDSPGFTQRFKGAVDIANPTFQPITQKLEIPEEENWRHVMQLRFGAQKILNEVLQIFKEPETHEHRHVLSLV